MLGKSYTVKQGDTLWDLSKTYLDDPTRWPEIYQHNNNSEVVAKTGLRLVDPDLIFVNQKLYIPEERIEARPVVGKSGKVKAKSKVRSVAFKYEFDAIPLFVVMSPTHVATVSLVGSVSIQSEKTYDILAIQKDAFMSSAKAEADTVFGKLLADAKVGWNEGQKKATFEIGVTLQSKTRFAPEVSVSAGISNVIPGLPVMKVSMKTQPMNQPSGKIAGHFYTTSEFGVEMEIFPKQGNSVESFVGEPVAVGASSPSIREMAMPRPVNLPTELAMPKPNADNNTATANKTNWWTELSPGVMKAAAYILIAATIVEDVVTLGAGVADDAASFMLAAAMLRFAASRQTVKTVVRTGTQIAIQGGRTTAGVLGAGAAVAAPAHAQ